MLWCLWCDCSLGFEEEQAPRSPLYIRPSDLIYIDFVILYKQLLPALLLGKKRSIQTPFLPLNVRGVEVGIYLCSVMNENLVRSPIEER